MLETFSRYLSLDGLGILLALVTLETVLSADNAVVLAALVGDIPHPEQQRRVLNWGLIVAFILRIILLMTATWVIQFWQFEVMGGLYLIWLASKHFWQYFAEDNREASSDSLISPHGYSFGRMISLIALTDLAFSLDSVTAAIALSDKIELVMTGCALGIITLRFLSGLFIRWLKEFSYLADAAYLTIFSVGIRLVMKVVTPDLIPPEWIMLTLIIILFSWGFSRRVSSEETETSETWISPLQPNPARLTR